MAPKYDIVSLFPLFISSTNKLITLTGAFHLAERTIYRNDGK